MKDQKEPPSEKAANANPPTEKPVTTKRTTRKNDGVSSKRFGKFEGREPVMKGHIYDLPRDRNIDQYIRTTRELQEYVGYVFNEYSEDLMSAVQNLQMPTLNPPANPDPTNLLEFELWKIDIREHRKRERVREDFLVNLYNVILGQCTESLRDRLTSHEDFPTVRNDGIRLLKLIKSIMYSY